jgi:phage-related protein
MPEIKNTFIEGKMNKDLDERLIPNGQYRDAENIKVSTSDDGAVGVVQNILGNKRVEDYVPAGYVCIATIADEKNNNIYWFVTNETTHSILQYNLQEDLTKFVLVDIKNDTLKFTQNIITGINIIDDLLFWTDNYSEPKKININDCIQGTVQTGLIHSELFVDGISKGDISEKHITVIRQSPKHLPLTSVNEPTDENTQKLFEQVFPRFSLRYKYKDGEYSSFGPFTQVVFNPKYIGDDVNKDNAYSVDESYNLAMINNVESIEISNFVSTSTPEDVVQIEILYKEDGSSVVFSIKKINYDDNEWTNNSFTLKSESIFAAIPENQLLRIWDNVPKKALAQEITGNRLVYGNYTQGYDLFAFGNDNKVSNKLESSFELRNSIGNSDLGGLPSLKTQRNYQVGFVWGDEYGRETPVFTSDEGGVNIPWYDINLDYLASKSLILKTNLNTNKPVWADYYKIYVKETSGDYYNLIMDKAYVQTGFSVFDDQEDRVWLSFPSADRNKVTIDDYLILKREIGSSEQVKLENKFKILDIQNEAPDAIKFEYKVLGKATQTDDASTGDYLTNTLFPSTGTSRIDHTTDMIHVKKGDWLDVTGGGSLTPDNDNDNLWDDSIYISWAKGNSRSSRYRVISANTLGTPAYYRLKLDRSIEEEDAAITNDAGTIDDIATTFSSNLQFFAEVKTEKDLDEFSGRFFVQLVYKPPTFDPADNVLDNPFKIVGRQKIHWFYDPVATDSIDLNGIVNINVNLGTIGTPTDTSKAVTTSTSGSTYEASEWGELSTQLENSDNQLKPRGFFIDNMYMVAGQPFNDNTRSTSVKLSGKTWIGMFQGIPRAIPRWEIIDSIGTYGWTASNSISASPITGHFVPLDPSLYSPRPFGLYGGHIEVDPTHAMNGLEGFLTTGAEHVGDTTNSVGVGYRRWRGEGNSLYPLAGLGDDTYGDIDAAGNIDEQGRFFIHISFLGPGKNLHDGIWANNPFSSGELKGPNSPGAHMQAIWGGGIFTHNGLALEMEGNYQNDGLLTPLPGTPGPGVGYGYDTSNNYGTDNDRQWDPSYPSEEDEGGKIATFIQNLRSPNATFKFSSSSDVEFKIKSIKEKRIYNHTPWIAQYKWDGVGTNTTATPSVDNGGLVLCDNSVDEAAQTFLTDTNDQTNFEALQNKITQFGKRDNRRTVYIIEVDKNPLQEGVFTSNSPELDSNTALSWEFISSDQGVLLEDILDNPAVWETEAKAGEELDIYYEASQAIPLRLTDKTNELFAPIGSRVEILNLPEARNGELTIDEDIFVASWSPTDSTEVNLTGDGFNRRNVSGANIDYANAQIRFFRPDGSYTTTRIIQEVDGPPDGVVNLKLDPTLDVAMEQGAAYFNCFSFGNGVESNRVRDDFNAPAISKGVKASLVLETDYKEENRKNGLIFSGIYNSTSGVNNLNQFILAENITKDLNPTYGSIQKLFQRRISLVTFCEDKVVSIVSNKDALFNADGNVQLVSTNNVLGDATPFVGDYGISKNPESFAKESYRAYFTDKQRGAVLRLSMDGLTPISDAGMDDYFRDNLRIAGEAIGSYDAHSKNYNLTLKYPKPGDNIIANNSFDLGVDSTSAGFSNTILNPDINSFTTYQPVSLTLSNWIVNGDIDVQTTITNYDEIPAGSLIPQTFSQTITSTPGTFEALSYPNSAIVNQGFETGNNWGNFYETSFDNTDPLGTWSSSGGSGVDPFSNNYGNTSPYQMYMAKVSYSGRFASTTTVPFPQIHNSQSGSAVGESEDIFWYNGVNDPNGTFSDGSFGNGLFPATQTTEPGDGAPGFNTEGIVFDRTFSTGCFKTLILPGEARHFALSGGIMSGHSTLISSDVMSFTAPSSSHIHTPNSQPFQFAQDTTIFNGEQVRIDITIKNPEDFDSYYGGTGSRPDNPRYLVLTLYDGFDSARTPVSNSIIYNADAPGQQITTLPYGSYFNNPVPAVDTFKNSGQSGWDGTTHNYATSASVAFNYMNDANCPNDFIQEHQVSFKFNDGTEEDKILVQNLQVEICLLDEIPFSYVHGIVTSFQMRKSYSLKVPGTTTSATVPDNNALPATTIPAFALVNHSLGTTILRGTPGGVNLFEPSFVKLATDTDPAVGYGPNFAALQTVTLDQMRPDGTTPTGNTASYVFPLSSNVSNGTTFYDDGSGATGMFSNTSTFGGGTLTHVDGIGGSTSGTAQSYGTAALQTTDDAFIFDDTRTLDTILFQYNGGGLVLDDWYFYDIRFNGTPTIPTTPLKIQSVDVSGNIGSAHGTEFVLTTTDIYGTSEDVLRAIFQIDNIQSQQNYLKVRIPQDADIEIESTHAQEINTTYTGGSITNWSFNNVQNFQPQHSFDVPSIYGSSNGIEFDVAHSNSGGLQRYSFQQLNPIPVENTDGYRFSFTLSNYASGYLHFYVIGKDASGADQGIVFKKPQAEIYQDGDYHIDFNFDGGAYDLFFDDGTGPVSLGTSDQYLNEITEKVTFLSNGQHGFVGCVTNISLVDKTIVFSGGSVDSFTIEGFDPTLEDFITFEDLGSGEGQVLFNNAPITGSVGDVRIQQGISANILENDTYKLKFEHDIAVGGSIGVYYYSSNGNKGFKVNNISGAGPYNVVHTMNEDWTAGHEIDTLVFFVDADGTTGTIDDIVFRQEYLIQDDFPSTISYSEKVRGWVSFKSFIPEQGDSIAGEYFTVKEGGLFLHNVKDESRNTFYGNTFDSTITTFLNTSPSSIKIFNTLNYEGTQSNVKQHVNTAIDGNDYTTLSEYNLNQEDGWSVEYIKTDKQEGTLDEFIEKEGKWFNYIKGLNSDQKTSDLSFQGLGAVKTSNTIP